MKKIFFVIATILAILSISIKRAVAEDPQFLYLPLISYQSPYIHPIGEVVVHEGNQDTKFDWLVYVPRTISKTQTTYILIDGTRGSGTCSQAESTEEALGNIPYSKQFADEFGLILLYPAIYDVCNQYGDITQWAGHFNIPNFSNTPENPHFRVDLKVNNMIDLLTEMLSRNGYTMAEKVFVHGYSIGGHFANRYSMLQPDRVKAFVAGGTSGEITLPITAYEGVTDDLIWNSGVSDYETLVGEPFDYTTYSQIPQLYLWGENDLDHYWLDGKCSWYGGWYCDWRDVWGFDSAEALRNQCSYLQDLGVNAFCWEYPDIGHTFTEEMWFDHMTS